MSTLPLCSNPSLRSPSGSSMNVVHKWFLVFCCIAVLGVPAVRAAQSVQSLQYGVVLFHYFQGDYFNALTELMVADQRDELAVHGDNAQLLRGGMSLSWGMDREAERIFSQSSDLADQQANRDRAWFYLARMAWQRGDSERAKQALSRVSSELPVVLAEEAQYLAAAIALHHGDQVNASQLVDQLPTQSPWQSYFHYNLGAANAAAGAWPAAISAFERVEAQEASSPELRALRDKSHTAAGYAYLAAGEPQQAQVEFRKVRLMGPQTDRALLGYGWAAGEGGDYTTALAPWQALSERSLMSASARESWLALPYAHEQLGEPGRALKGYQQAADKYAQTQALIEAQIAALQVDNLWVALGLTQHDSSEWVFGADLLPASDASAHLTHLIGLNDFQVALREYRDLRRIAQHLETAGKRLEVLVDASATQQQVRERHARSAALDSRRYALASLEQRLARLQQLIATPEHELAGGALADSRQARRWQRWQRIASSPALHHGDASARAKNLSLYRGLMLWDDAEVYPARVWELTQVARELETLIDTANNELQEIAKLSTLALSQAPADVEIRLEALKRQVSDQGKRVEMALVRAEDGVRQVAITELQRQVRELQHAAGQSQLAIARLYDRHNLETAR